MSGSHFAINYWLADEQTQSPFEYAPSSRYYPVFFVNSTQVFHNFTSLPPVLRDLVYIFAAIDEVPLRARNTIQARLPPLKQRRKSAKTVLGLRTANKHTLHSLSCVSKAIYAEVKQAIYRYVPVVVVLGTHPVRQALGLQPSRRKRSINSDMLAEVAKYPTVILQYGMLSTAIQISEQEFRAFFRWWDSSFDDYIGIPHNRKLYIRLCEITQKKDVYALNVFSAYIAKHKVPERLKKSVCFTLDGMTVEEQTALRECAVATSNRSYAGRLVPSCWVSLMIADIRKFCREHHELIDSEIDWAGMKVHQLEHGLEQVRFVYDSRQCERRTRHCPGCDSSHWWQPLEPGS